VRVRALWRHEWRILAQQWPLFAGAVVMPLIVMVFLKSTFRVALVSRGFPNATGAEQAVPGVAVMFSFFMMGVVALAFLREHGFGTWDRLRASPMAPWEVIVGKLGPLAVVAALQQALLFAAGFLGAGLHIQGSALALALVVAGLVAAVLGLGVAVMAVCSTQPQVALVQLVGTMLFAGLGGAFSPEALTPTFAKVIGPLVPSYWAMHGYRAVILDGAGVRGVAPSVAALLGFAVVFAGVAVRRFRSEEPRASWW
jgi:ABC-2 type transport system permease protein